MSYIGRDIRTGAFRQLDDISSGFDGSDTTHTMQVNSTNVSVGDVNQILLSLGGVIQKPGTDFTVSGSVLTFTTAPASGLSFFAILLGSDNGGTVTPPDGSVTTDKIVDANITKAKLADAIDIFNNASLLAGDLGTGIHIKTADSSGDVSTSADNLVIEDSGDSGMTILGGTSNHSRINFGDSGDNDIGQITYDHGANAINIKTNASGAIYITDDGEVTMARQPSFRVISADMTNILRNQYVNIQFNSEVYDIGSNFNTSTYTFTAPVTGKYFLGVQILFQSVPQVADYLGVRVETSNGGYWSYLQTMTATLDADATYFHVTTAGVYDMDASDTAYVRMYLNDSGTGSNVLDINSGATYFSGHLLG